MHELEQAHLVQALLSTFHFNGHTWDFINQILYNRTLTQGVYH